MFAVERRQQRKQVSCCTVEKVPGAQLTHPTCIIALLLHFFHYCYHVPFQYLWLGVTDPIELSLWKATSYTATVQYKYTELHLRSLSVSLSLSRSLSLSLSPYFLFFLLNLNSFPMPNRS